MQEKMHLIFTLAFQRMEQMGKNLLIFALAFNMYSSGALAFSVGTYNIWHGLNGQGSLSIGELEKTEARKLREAQQNQYIVQLLKDTDILFLQEVNPVFKRSRVLKRKSPQTDFVTAPDMCGVRLGPIGIPVNMYSGLAILANARYRLKKIASHTLSGGQLVLPPLLCFHFSERRVALFAKATIPNHGDVLLVNVHLHHKLGLSDQYRAFLQAQLTTGKITQADHKALVNRAKEASHRRGKEVLRLIQYIKKYKKKYSIEKVIVGGDFNTDIRGKGPNLALFEEATGLIFPMDSVPQDYFSWSPGENTNRPYMVDFATDELANDPDITPGMGQVLEENPKKPRLIDLIYVSENFLEKPPTFTPIGVRVGPEGRHFSDHFGYKLGFK